MSSTAPPINKDDTQTRSLLFLDVHGWSKLQPKEIREYVTHALPEIAKLLAGSSFKNTWGDGIVATFGSANAAALAALQIRDFFVQRKTGIAERMTCRISLHQGDVLLLDNAIRNSEDIFGDAVHLAARLEPVTLPGSVFATDRFAAALRDTKESNRPIAKSLGVRPLAKEYGPIEVFVVTYPGERDHSSELKTELDAATGHRAGLRAVRVYRTRDDAASITYKLKLHVVFKNESAGTITIRTPEWRSGPQDAAVQSPIATALVRELEDKGGGKADQWEGDTSPEVRLNPGRVVRAWVGLNQAIQDMEFDKRLREGRLGSFVLPVVDGDVEYDVVLPVW